MAYILLNAHANTYMHSSILRVVFCIIEHIYISISQERYPYIFEVVYGTLAIRQVNTCGEYPEHCFPVFLLELMVLLTMLYPGEPSRAVESDKVCTCFTELLDVCVQALAVQLHALIRIIMSCLFLADIPGHNQNALRDISSVPGRHSQP